MTKKTVDEEVEIFKIKPTKMRDLLLSYSRGDKVNAIAIKAGLTRIIGDGYMESVNVYIRDGQSIEFSKDSMTEPDNSMRWNYKITLCSNLTQDEAKCSPEEMQELLQKVSAITDVK